MDGLRGYNNTRRGAETKNRPYSTMQNAKNDPGKIEAGFCEGGRRKKTPWWPEKEGGKATERGKKR